MIKHENHSPSRCFTGQIQILIWALGAVLFPFVSTFVYVYLLRYLADILWDTLWLKANLMQSNLIAIILETTFHFFDTFDLIKTDLHPLEMFRFRMSSVYVGLLGIFIISYCCLLLIGGIETITRHMMTSLGISLTDTFKYNREQQKQVEKTSFESVIYEPKKLGITKAE